MKVDVLHTRIDQHEEEIKVIKESLVGNVTTRTMKQWVIGTAAVMVALITLFSMLQKLS